MLKPIIFIDFDGTLCHDRFWRSLEPEQFAQVQKYLFGLDKSIVKDWMKGIYTSEDVNQKVAQMLRIEYQVLLDLFIRDCESMCVDQSVLDKINQLREKYQTILLTDNMDCFIRFTVPALKLGKYFDLIINSHNEKMSKNDYLSKKNLSGSILVDNSKETCDFFETLGGKSFYVTKDNPLSYWLGTLA